jgi:hypothetical protein
MSLSKYLTMTLYKSAKHKHEKIKQTRRELAQFKRETKLARRLIKEIYERP